MTNNSSSYTEKSLESLNSVLQIPKPHYYKNITSSLHLARNKLLSIINDVLKTVSDNSLKASNQYDHNYRISIDQYNEVMEAVQLLKEVDEALRKNSSKTQFNQMFKQPNFNFDVKVKINKNGKIYIDPPLLDQLIDLHNLLGDIIDFMQELLHEGYKDVSNVTEVTQYQPDTVSSGNVSESRQVRVEKITREILTCLTLPLKTDFTVMTSTEQRGEPDPVSNSIEEPPEKEEDINAAGAKKIIIKCIADLDKVRNFLEKDFSEPEVRKSHTESANKEKEKTKTRSFHSLADDTSQICLCPDTCPKDQPLEFTWKENGENGSKLVICIKGKTEEEGDIQVVIRQCPECLNNAKEDDEEDTKIEADVDQSTQETKTPSVEHTDKQSVEKVPKESIEKVENGKRPSKEVKKPSSQSISKPKVSKHTNNEQTAADQQNINVIFDPDNPSSSVVEGPNIHLNDTINLNLIAAECNQDLVISLSVKPKGIQPKHVLNIDDIFNDSQASIRKSKTSVERTENNDKVMPIFRTKICSSMDIDVDVVKSKLHTIGVQHQNIDVETKLNDIGVNNILRASRPAKCGRMAVLGEYSCKNLPYSPSLRSLPLSDLDIKLVNQSLNMSVNKMKQSRIYPGEKYTYFMVIFQQNVKFFNAAEVLDI